MHGFSPPPFPPAPEMIGFPPRNGLRPRWLRGVPWNRFGGGSGWLLDAAVFLRDGAVRLERMECGIFEILLMDKILHQLRLVVFFSHYLQGFYTSQVVHNFFHQQYVSSWWFFPNPSEKYESKWVHLPQFSGWTYKRFETTTQAFSYICS